MEERRRGRRSKEGVVMRLLRRTLLVVSIAVTVIATVAWPTNAESAFRHSIIGTANLVIQSRPISAHALGSVGDAVTAWNANAGEASVAACFLGGYGPQEARMYAMIHVAIYDALNGIDRRSRPYAVNLHAAPGTSPDAAVAAAAHDVLVPVLGSFFFFFLPADCIDAGVGSVEADYADALDAIPDGLAKTQGIALGQDAAEAILALRASDGYDTPTVDPNYQEGRTRRVPLHTGHSLRLRPCIRRRPHPLRLEGQLAVPPGAAVPADQS
jgi:hypothetical protein